MTTLDVPRAYFFWSFLRCVSFCEWLIYISYWLPTSRCEWRILDRHMQASLMYDVL